MTCKHDLLQTTCVTCGEIVCEKALPKMEWISIKDCKPKQGFYSIKSEIQGQSGTGYWNGQDWESIHITKGSLMFHSKNNITHWALLP